MKHFCTAGPVQPDIHYLIPPLQRVNRDEIHSLIADRKYFILHAPRQTGKTSSLNALVDDLNASGKYKALYVNIEAAQAARDNIEEGMRAIVSELARRADVILGDPFLKEHREEVLRTSFLSALQQALSAWCGQSALPICLMIDEIDALVGDTLISVLRQLRAGYTDRPKGFPQCIVLCGVRDIRDYRIHGAREIITGGSAFNVKAESLRLGDFTPADVQALYEQHTTETGQEFEESVYPLVWDLTRGQPWLVNALAYEACFRLEKDRTKPITCELIEQAKENLILKRAIHLDQLTDKLREPRVQRVIQPILNGDDRISGPLSDDDDVQYCFDLGLIRRGPEGLEIANAIYREAIPRQLTYITQIEMEARERTVWYVAPDGRLDMTRLMASFQQFFRENSEIWMERYTYREAGPQLLLQAFLQRIVNGGGRIDREYALGRRRTDLLVIWNHPIGIQRAVIEIKLVRGSVEKTIAEGLTQTAGYVERTGAEEAHLVLFHRDPAVSWDDKIYQREEMLPGGRRATIWGM